MAVSSIAKNIPGNNIVVETMIWKQLKKVNSLLFVQDCGKAAKNDVAFMFGRDLVFYPSSF